MAYELEAFNRALERALAARDGPLDEDEVRSILLAAGVPLREAVPLPLSVKETPAGRLPFSVNVGFGKPLVVMLKVPGLPTVNVVAAPLLMAAD